MPTSEAVGSRFFECAESIATRPLRSRFERMLNEANWGKKRKATLQQGQNETQVVADDGRDRDDVCPVSAA